MKHIIEWAQAILAAGLIAGCLVFGANMVALIAIVAWKLAKSRIRSFFLKHFIQ